MKVLLLTDIPPCDDFTAGLVLSAMVRFLPPGSVCCFAVVNPTLPLRISSEFSGIPTEFHAKPNENWAWLPQRRLLRKASALVSFLGEGATERLQVRKLIEQAIVFGKKEKVDRVWAVLQGQTIIRMAQPVAEGLDVPLHTHVWDPFSWWAKANCLNGWTTQQVQNAFDGAIAASRSVATASQPMAENFRERFGVHALPVISSHPQSLARAPLPETDEGDTLFIGMAGQFYSATEWSCLVQALDSAGWRVAGRPVRLVVMGPQTPPHMDKGKITYLGWKTQAQAAEILSCCDLLYCPYPFDPSMKEVSQFSFPSKLVLYLAAGRPIVFHGPAYASPAHYVKGEACGLVVDRLLPTSAFNAVERLVTDADLYRQSTLSTQAAFRKDFTLASMHRSFAKFIGLDPEGEEAVLHRHEAGPEAAPHPDSLSDEDRGRNPSMLVLGAGRRVKRLSEAARSSAKRGITRLALKVPRLRSLHHEVQSQYAEIAELKHRLARLQDENAQLRQRLDASDGAADVRVPATVQPSVDWATLGGTGSRPMILGEPDYVRRLLPTLPDAMDRKSDPAGGILAYAVDVSGQTLAVREAHVVPKNPGSDIAPALRMALEANTDVVVAASRQVSDPTASAAIRLGALLGLPVILAVEQADETAALPKGVTIRNLETNVPVAERAGAVPQV